MTVVLNVPNISVVIDVTSCSFMNAVFMGHKRQGANLGLAEFMQVYELSWYHDIES